MYKLLLVEDALDLATAMRDYLTETNKGSLEITIITDGDEAISNVRDNDYDLALLDVMLPGASGFDVLRAVRQKGSCPVIIMTALSDEENLLYGYDLGADDYMTKPVLLSELNAKINALLRRTADNHKDKLIKIGGITLNESRMSVEVDGNQIELPSKEYLILRLLMSEPDRVFSRDRILDRVWAFNYDVTDRVVDAHIKNLRKALGRESGRIKTVIGSGYKISTK
ncbi:MAG: response regulator transcription factor [Clostridiales bacterium]|nr:response regulator transcription factor [Clostridiales bacterium]